MAALRETVRRVRDAAEELAPPRWTVFRVERGLRPPDPTAFAGFGPGAWIAPPARFQNPDRVVLGRETGLMEHAYVSVLDTRQGGDPNARVELGDRTRLARFNTIVCGVGITLGRGVSSSDWVAILDTWQLPCGPAASGVPPPPGAAVVIGDGVFLGPGCTIMPGVTIGTGAYVGKGAVVTDDVPAHAKVYGNPASVTRRFDGAAWSGPEWP